MVKNFKSTSGYIISSNDEIERLVLTSVDLELFLEHYEVRDLKYIQGLKFKAKRHLFDSYIEKWTKVKIESKKQGNFGKYKISKIMLNSLYGKFGLSPDVAGKTPYLSEDGIVKYHIEESEIRDGIYIPMACFITAYARRKTITTSQKIRDFSLKNYGEDYYVYSDTDSVHCIRIPMEELEKIIEIDKYKLGAWDLEKEPEFGKYIRQKSYIDSVNGELQVTCAGLSKSCIMYNKDKTRVFRKIYDETRESVGCIENDDCKNCDKLGSKHCYWKEFDINAFKVGFTCGGKLTYKHVKGGVILEETSFLLKEKL